MIASPGPKPDASRTTHQPENKETDMATRPATTDAASGTAPTIADIMERLDHVDDAVAAVHNAIVEYDEAQQAELRNTPSRRSASPSPNGAHEAARRFGAEK